MPPTGPDTDQLLTSVSQGDVAARSQLLRRHQERLRQMIAVRLDRRLAPRLDPSDVVQDVLATADKQLSDFARRRPLPFHAWLRQIALDRLADMHRRHIQAEKRSVTREQGPLLGLPEESAWELAERLCSPGSGPGARLEREELRAQVQRALAQLSERDREVLVMRHLERLEVAEIAEALGVSAGAVHTRHLRALRRLRELLKSHPEDGR